jgi:hypothetical protein
VEELPFRVILKSEATKNLLSVGSSRAEQIFASLSACPDLEGNPRGREEQIFRFAQDD